MTRPMSGPGQTSQFDGEQLEALVSAVAAAQRRLAVAERYADTARDAYHFALRAERDAEGAVRKFTLALVERRLALAPVLS